jgi:hypothetical protein
MEEASRLVGSNPPGAPQARADLALFNQLHSELLNDGVSAGLAFNSINLIIPGIALFKKLKLSKTVALLQAVEALLPPKTKRSPRNQEKWFDDPARAAKLDALEAKADACELLRKGWNTAFDIIIASPADFFEDPHNLGFSHPVFVIEQASKPKQPADAPSPASKFQIRTYKTPSPRK